MNSDSYCDQSQKQSAYEPIESTSRMKTLFVTLMAAILFQAVYSKKPARGPPSQALMEEAKGLQVKLNDMRVELEECSGEVIPERGFQNMNPAATRHAHVLKKKMEQMERHLRKMSAALDECRELEEAAAAAAARIGVVDVTTDATDTTPTS